MESQPSSQSLFQKLHFDSNSQKTRKSRYQTFLVLSSFTGFLYFVPNILPSIVSANKFLVLIRPTLLQNLIFWHFVCCQSISPNFKQSVRQVSHVKISSLTVLCKQYFACQKLTLESFHHHLLVVFDRTNFYESNEHFFQKLESFREVKRAKRNFLELYNVLIKARLTTSKTKHDF